MEGNKDEAEKCLQLGKKYMEAGNYEKADKFLKKADNLYPSDRAKDLLNVLKSSSFTKTSQPSSDTGGPRKRTTNAESTKAPEPKLNVDYTKEQLDIVSKIKKCKDFYEVLGVTKESTDSEIKKAYKKLALQLHPDKNKAPGAVESFKALGNAVAILTDPEKRKTYDLYGADERNTASNFGPRRQTYEYAYQRGFESDVTADELFNMFFGGGFPQQNQRQRRYQQQPNHDHQNGQPSLVFGLVLVFILVSMISTFLASDPLYSLQPTSKYNIERRTLTHKIPYYVKDNFAGEYQGSIGRLENSVEEEYIVNMKRACYNERNYREAMMVRAKSFGSKSQYAQAQQLKTASCDTLYRLGVGKVNY